MFDHLPFVRASITPLFSRYFRNSCFLDSGVYEDVLDQLAERGARLCMTGDFIEVALLVYIVAVIMQDETEAHTIS